MLFRRSDAYLDPLCAGPLHPSCVRAAAEQLMLLADIYPTPPMTQAHWLHMPMGVTAKK